MVFSIGVHGQNKNVADGNYVVMYLDKRQISELIKSLCALRDDPKIDVLNYFSSEWGDGSLSMLPQEDGTETTHRLKNALYE